MPGTVACGQFRGKAYAVKKPESGHQKKEISAV